MSVVTAKDTTSAVIGMMGIAPTCGSCFMGCATKTGAEQQACAMACGDAPEPPGGKPCKDMAAGTIKSLSGESFVACWLQPGPVCRTTAPPAAAGLCAQSHSNAVGVLAWGKLCICQLGLFSPARPLRAHRCASWTPACPAFALSHAACDPLLPPSTICLWQTYLLLQMHAKTHTETALTGAHAVQCAHASHPFCLWLCMQWGVLPSDVAAWLLRA